MSSIAGCKCGIDVIFEFRSRTIKSLSSSRVGPRDLDAEDKAVCCRAGTTVVEMSFSSDQLAASCYTQESVLGTLGLGIGLELGLCFFGGGFLMWEMPHI